MPEELPLYLCGSPDDRRDRLDVHNVWTGEVAYRTSKASAEDFETAVAGAVEAAPRMAALRMDQRRDVLRHCIDYFRGHHDQLVADLVTEAGKPVKFARGEVDRLISTFEFAAVEAMDITIGESFDLAVSEGRAGYRGMSKRVPIGPCGFITPFNFPLNLVAHKVAPAIAAGCPFILKPADKTPVGALRIGEALAECDLPRGSWSILPADVESATALVEDDRLKLLSFTGSDKVGWQLKAKAGKKKVVLELGGNAACIVDATADLDDTARRIATAAFGFAGQTCISVQRVIIERQVFDAFCDTFGKAARRLTCGNPADAGTVVGPMINADAADRVERWINESEGRVLTGGKRDGNVIRPAVLADVPHDEPLWAEEAFGPVCVVEVFRDDDFDEAIALANESRFGLQVGVFTRDLLRAMHAWDHLEAGGIIVNDTPSFRVDPMPYGGVKDSGLGREGLRYAIAEMTEPRLLVIRGG